MPRFGFGLGFGSQQLSPIFGSSPVVVYFLGGNPTKLWKVDGSNLSVLTDLGDFPTAGGSGKEAGSDGQYLYRDKTFYKSSDDTSKIRIQAVDQATNTDVGGVVNLDYLGSDKAFISLTTTDSGRVFLLSRFFSDGGGTLSYIIELSSDLSTQLNIRNTGNRASIGSLTAVGERLYYYYLGKNYEADIDTLLDVDSGVARIASNTGLGTSDSKLISWSSSVFDELDLDTRLAKAGGLSGVSKPVSSTQLSHLITI